MSALLQRYLGDAGFKVHRAGEARQGVETARELQPDCIICDDELPDIDGFWVVQKVRHETTRVGSVPILFLTEDLEALQQHNLQVDLFLKKPLNNDEVAMQARALLNMAKRLRAKRSDSANPPSTVDGRAALRGDIAQMSVPTVLTVLEMERRTGELTVERKGGPKAEFGLVEGSMTTTLLGGTDQPAVDAIRKVVGWKEGRFWFNPVDRNAGPDVTRHSIGMLLLEAARLEDEGNEGR
jgi:DNA-binding response OmpR family regulator